MTSDDSALTYDIFEGVRDFFGTTDRECGKLLLRGFA